MATPAIQGHQTFLLHCLRKDIAYNTTGIASGVSMGAVPAGAVIMGVHVQVTAAFNAGTTNVLIVGSAADDDAYMAAGDVAEGSTGSTLYTGKGAHVSANTEVFVKFTESGTAASAGAAKVMVLYALDPAALA